MIKHGISQNVLSFHTSPRDLLHRSLYELSAWGEIADLRKLFDDVLPAKNAVHGFEITQVFPGLGHKIFLLNAQILAPNGSILLAIEDVTASRSGALSLRESEQRYRLMAQEVIDYAIFSLDTRGHIVTWSEGAHRIKQYTEQEVLGKHFRILYPEDDRENRKPEWELETVSREGRFKDFGWRRKKDGTAFWAEVVITAMHNESEELIGFGKVVKDLTEAKRIEEERERLRDLEMVAETSVRQQSFLRDVLYSVTNRKLHLCASPADLPPRGRLVGELVPVTNQNMARLRRLSLRVAQAEKFETERLHDLVTAVGEATMNAVVHGGGGTGSVCIVPRDDGSHTLQVWVEDKGQGDDAGAASPCHFRQRSFDRRDPGTRLLFDAADRGPHLAADREHRDIGRSGTGSANLNRLLGTNTRITHRKVQGKTKKRPAAGVQPGELFRNRYL